MRHWPHQRSALLALKTVQGSSTCTDAVEVTHELRSHCMFYQSSNLIILRLYKSGNKSRPIRGRTFLEEADLVASVEEESKSVN